MPEFVPVRSEGMLPRSVPTLAGKWIKGFPAGYPGIWVPKTSRDGFACRSRCESFALSMEPSIPWGPVILHALVMVMAMAMRRQMRGSIGPGMRACEPVFSLLP
jgi:hypothetical protein